MEVKIELVDISDADSIISNFNFDLVLAYCTLTKREYIGEPVTMPMLKATARTLLYMCIREQDIKKRHAGLKHATGGFEACLNVWDNIEYLRLNFYIATWSENGTKF